MRKLWLNEFLRLVSRRYPHQTLESRLLLDLGGHCWGSGRVAEWHLTTHSRGADDAVQTSGASSASRENSDAASSQSMGSLSKKSASDMGTVSARAKICSTEACVQLAMQLSAPQSVVKHTMPSLSCRQ